MKNTMINKREVGTKAGAQIGRSTRWLINMFAAVLILMTALATFASGATTYVPWIAYSQSDWNTPIQVQNIDTSAASVSVSMYDQNGSLVQTQTATIQPRTAATFWPPAGPTIGGSAVITSAQNIIAVVNEMPKNGKDSMSYSGFTQGAVKVYIPWIAYSQSDWNTPIQVQNIAASAASVSVSMYDQNGSLVQTQTATIQPRTAATFWPPAGPTTGGSAVITSTQNVVAIVNEMAKTGPQSMSYEGFASGAGKVYIPVINFSQGNTSTPISVQNISAGSASVSVSIYDSNGALVQTQTATIQPNTASVFWPPAASTTYGSAVITSTQNIVAIVNMMINTNIWAMSYDGSPAGSTQVFIPWIAYGNSGWNTPVYVQNTGTASANVTIAFYDQNGGLVETKNTAIPANASKKFDPAASAPTTGGSAVITSSQPVTAVVTEINASNTQAMAYGGTLGSAAPPTIAINSPADNSTVNTAGITVSGTASAGVSKVEISNGGAYLLATGTTSWSANVTLSSGINTITARATDTSGSIFAVSITITYSAGSSGTPSTTTTITYDMAGRKTGMTDPDMGTWSYAYDSNSNLTSQTDAKSQTITFTYDKLNRVTLKDYPGTTYDTNYVYDNTVTSPGGKGRLYKVYGYSGGVNNQYFETYAYYDELGRPKQSRLYLETGKDWTTYTSYDVAGRVSTTTYPDGEVVTYRYNKAGALDSPDGGVTPAVQSSMYTSYPYVKDITFNPMGQMASITFGNNRITSYDYYDTGTVTELDSNLTYTYRLKSVVTDGSVQNFTYGYDKNGNVMRVTDGLNANYNATYSYDDLSRLTGATATVFGTQSFTYNAIGNLLNKDGRTYTYPATGTIRPHAPTGDGTYTYTYDNNGNMITRSGGRTFNWDYDNMVSSIVDGTTTKGTYAYAEGARIKKVENGITTYYVGGIYEEEWSGPTKLHITKYYSVGSGKAKRRDNTALSFIHTDHLGSSSRTTDANGALQYTIVYKPYGEDAYSNDTGAMDYRFTGKEKDDATGLYYYGARYYDPAMARFISADPVEGPNRYAYVGNNPVNRIDPTGNFLEEAKGLLDKGISIAKDAVHTGYNYLKEGVAWYQGTMAAGSAQAFCGSYCTPSERAGMSAQKLHDDAIESGAADLVASGIVTAATIEVGGASALYVKGFGEAGSIAFNAGATMQKINTWTALFATAESLTSPSGYDPWNATINYFSFMGFGGAAGPFIAAGGSVANKINIAAGLAEKTAKGVEYTSGLLTKKGLAGRGISAAITIPTNIVYGNIYGAFQGPSMYLQKGSTAGWADKFWNTRPLWIEANTANGIAQAVLPPSVALQVTGFVRGGGFFLQKRVEGSGLNVNTILPGGPQLQSGVNYYRHITDTVLFE